MFIHVLKPKLNYATLSDEPSYEIVVINNRRMLVHRLIAAAFLGPRPSGKIVHHRDHVKRNNKPRNLEYVTPSDNTRMAYADGRIGRTHKLTAFARKKIVELYERGEHRTLEIAEQFRVSRSTILSIVRRAGVTPHRMRKLTPALYAEIRYKYARGLGAKFGLSNHSNYKKYSIRDLAQEYNVSNAMIEFILGMRACRPGKRLPKIGSEDMKRDPLGSGLYKIRKANHPQEGNGNG